MRQQPGFFQHEACAAGEVLECRRAAECPQLASGDLVAELRLVPEREERLSATRGGTRARDRQHLLLGEVGGLAASGRTRERAVPADVPTEGRERDEDLGRVGDEPSRPELSCLGEQVVEGRREELTDRCVVGDRGRHDGAAEHTRRHTPGTKLAPGRGRWRASVTVGESAPPRGAWSEASAALPWWPAPTPAATPPGQRPPRPWPQAGAARPRPGERPRPPPPDSRASRALSPLLEHAALRRQASRRLAGRAGMTPVRRASTWRTPRSPPPARADRARSSIRARAGTPPPLLLSEPGLQPAGLGARRGGSRCAAPAHRRPRRA